MRSINMLVSVSHLDYGIFSSQRRFPYFIFVSYLQQSFTIFVCLNQLRFEVKNLLLKCCQSECSARSIDLRGFESV
jgi:hypothetical protein